MARPIGPACGGSPARGRGRVVFTCRGVVLAGFLLGAAAQPVELVDRVLAVVNGQPLMLSELRGFVELGLLEVALPNLRSADVVARLIDRRLMLAEAERFPLPPPDAAAIDAALATVTARVPTRAAFEAALARAGFTEARVRAIVRENLRIARYLAERFGAPAEPTEEEIRQYYRDHPTAFTVDGRLRPFEEVRDLARARLGAERRDALVEQWLAELRRRADIVRLDQPEPAGPPHRSARVGARRIRNSGPGRSGVSLNTASGSTLVSRCR